MHNDEHKLMGVIFPLLELSIRLIPINVYASVKMHNDEHKLMGGYFPIMGINVYASVKMHEGLHKINYFLVGYAFMQA